MWARFLRLTKSYIVHMAESYLFTDLCHSTQYQIDKYTMQFSLLTVMMERIAF